ncbi:MAG: 5'-nucleotidase C-terminal domain-containing protein [Candidatus Marinimicrobia bacterium]|nr:5'-nucleotidase C-terminal domain-containing protein [Candidatus Neomarinimicrobiota bacterium]
MKSYGRIDLEYDIGEDRLLSISTSIELNEGGAPDAAVAAVVAKWSHRVDLELAEVIAFSSSGVEQHSDAMHNLVPDAWLWRFTQAAVATTNYGGYRQGFPAGDISLADMVGLLPFLNSLYMIDLTGLELINFVSSQGVAMGGMTTVGGFALNDESAIINDSVYTMMVTDYMDSAFDELRTYDATPVETGIHWRQPVIDWLINTHSSQAVPLEKFLDSAARR